MSVDAEVAAMQHLREAIESADLMACVRYDLMLRLAGFTDWYVWATVTSTRYVFDRETRVMVMTVEVSLSAAREMLARAEQTLADKMYEALR